MHQLQVDATAVAVVQKLRAAGIRPILLKGSSLSRWLYPAEPWRRGYTDVDLLVAPEQFKAAGAVLAQLGYRNVTDDQPQAHAFTWIPEPPDAVAVDLHRRLYFMRASDEAVWTALSESSDTIRLGPHQLEVMDLTARAMLLPLHAARHGIRTRKPLRDLEVALRRVDDETWRGGARLAEQLGASDAFAAGLRMLPTGEALATRLGLSRNASVQVHLFIETIPPTAFGLNALLQARSWSARAALIRAELLPTATFMRDWQPLAGHGRSGLALAYLWRPLWLISKLPRGARAVARARRASAGTDQSSVA